MRVRVVDFFVAEGGAAHGHAALLLFGPGATLRHREGACVTLHRHEGSPGHQRPIRMLNGHSERMPRADVGMLCYQEVTQAITDVLQVRDGRVTVPVTTR
eukprot:1866405-Rhodomonas_salina.5